MRIPNLFTFQNWVPACHFLRPYGKLVEKIETGNGIRIETDSNSSIKIGYKLNTEKPNYNCKVV